MANFPHVKKMRMSKLMLICFSKSGNHPWGICASTRQTLNQVFYQSLKGSGREWYICHQRGSTCTLIVQNDNFSCHKRIFVGKSIPVIRQVSCLPNLVSCDLCLSTAQKLLKRPPFLYFRWYLEEYAGLTERHSSRSLPSLLQKWKQYVHYCVVTQGKDITWIGKMNKIHG